LGCLGQAKQPLQPNILPPIILHQLQHQSLTCEPTQFCPFPKSGLGIDLASRSSIQFAFFGFWLVIRYNMLYIEYISGWWYTYPLKNMNVSWDDEIPNMMGKIRHVPNHQPDIMLFQLLTIINHRLTIDIPSHGCCLWHCLWHSLTHIYILIYIIYIYINIYIYQFQDGSMLRNKKHGIPWA